MALYSLNDERYPIPGNINPPDSVCYLIHVPNDPGHIQAFMGALFDLTQWINWQRDGTTRATQTARVWREIWLNLTPQDCASAVSMQVGADEGQELMIRQNPANPCELQSSIDGTTWCTFADLSLCFNFGTQGGSNSPQPPPGGGKQKYCNALNANGLLLLPTPVSTGDQITLEASGAGWDGSEFDFGPLWRCPDGSQFIAGQCTAFTTTNSGDPVPSAPHMALVYLINTTYYLATPTFTVPAGITNQQIQIQVNDSNLTNDQGSYQICATVTNNAAGTFSHVFDFTASPQGWVAHADPSITATWLAGQGWAPSSSGNPSSANIDLLSFPSRTLTSITIQYLDIGGGNPSSGILIRNNAGGTNWHLFTPLIASPGDQFASFTGNFITTSLFMQLEDGSTTSLVIAKVTINGIGTDPF